MKERDDNGRGPESFDLGVVGLGYVGLPMAVGASRAGLEVVGFDADARLIGRLRDAESHVETVSDVELAEARERGFSVIDAPEVLARARAIIICVPTPLRRGRRDLRVSVRR